MGLIFKSLKMCNNSNRLLILALYLLSFCAIPCLFARTTFAQSGDTLRFPSDGKLKIVVFSDAQTTQFVPGNLLDDMRAVLDIEKPDLVVFLGDQIEGKHPYIHIGDNTANVKSVISQLLAPVVERGIPFAVVFGNHDGIDSGVPKEFQMDYYRTFPGCLAADTDPSLPGCGTYHLVYYTHDGARPALDLYFVDSLEYAPTGGYSTVNKEQIEWCAVEMESVASQNGGVPVPAIYFQHIVVPEIYDAFRQLKNYEPGAFNGKGARDNNWYFAEFEGVREAPGAPDNSSGQFASWVNAKNVKAAFFGHDHKNSYTAVLNEIDLVACPGATFTAYNSSITRGARVIEIDENTIDSGVYKSRVVRFEDAEPRGFAYRLRRFLGQSYMWNLELPVIAALSVFFIIIVALMRKHKKRGLKS